MAIGPKNGNSKQLTKSGELTPAVKMAHTVALLICGGIGSFVAAIADVLLKDSASVILTMSQRANNVLGMQWCSPGWTILLASALGLAYVLSQDPKSKQEAFKLGASSLAVMVMLVPYKQPPSFESAAIPSMTNREIGFLENLVALDVVFANPQSPATSGARQELVEAEVQLDAGAGQPVGETTITLLAADSSRVLAQSTIRDRVFQFRQPPGVYILRVEAAGFFIVEDQVELLPGRNRIHVDLRGTTMAISLQRLLSIRDGSVSVKHLGTEIGTPTGTLEIATRNDARQVRPGWWAWTVYVEGTVAALDHVECIEYTLHPTFRERKHRVCERGLDTRAFAFAAAGWGTFDIGVQVFLKNGEVIELVHRLEF